MLSGDRDGPGKQPSARLLALLTFSPTTPDQNCETVGVSSADINGVVGVGRAP